MAKPADDDASVVSDGLEFAKVRGRDTYMAYHGDDVVAQVRRTKDADDWAVEIPGQTARGGFSSAVSAREFVFGFFAGRASKS